VPDLLLERDQKRRRIVAADQRAAHWPADVARLRTLTLTSTVGTILAYCRLSKKRIASRPGQLLFDACRYAKSIVKVLLPVRACVFVVCKSWNCCGTVVSLCLQHRTSHSSDSVDGTFHSDLLSCNHNPIQIISDGLSKVS